MQQVGQVMLALPHAISLMGLRAACVVIPCYTLFSIWTMHLLNALYVEYKARKVCTQCALLSYASCSGKHCRQWSETCSSDTFLHSAQDDCEWSCDLK